jgi:hypothetical protein
MSLTTLVVIICMFVSTIASMIVMCCVIVSNRLDRNAAARD